MRTRTISGDKPGIRYDRSLYAMKAMFPAAHNGLPRAPETMLVVDDYPALRYAMAHQCRAAGFLVYEASNAAEAMQHLQSPVRFSALITDVQMPGEMDGVALAVLAKQKWPTLIVTVVSASDLSVELQSRGIAFLRKPVSLEVLVRHLKDALSTS